MNFNKITSTGKGIFKNYLSNILQEQKIPKEFYVKKKTNDIRKMFLRKKYFKFEKEPEKFNIVEWKKYTEDLEILELEGLRLDEIIDRNENYLNRINALYNILDCQDEKNCDLLYEKYIECLKDEVINIYEVEIAICKQQLIIDKFKHEFSKEKTDQIRDLLSAYEQELVLLNRVLKDDCLKEIKTISIKELASYNAISLLNYIYFDLHKSKLYK